MKLNTVHDVKKYLVETGIADKKDVLKVKPLSGGVSCHVWKIILNNSCRVMKQALEKLEVEADWFSDVERIHREHEVMEALNPLLPKGSVPKVLHVDYTNHIYIMTCAEEGAQTWKEILMGGNFNASHAKKAASLLKQIHEQSNKMNEGDKKRFSDQKYFIQLRADAFHRYVMQKYPELSSSIQKLIDEVTLQKICLVHGDFSPKNMLIEKGNNIVLIDFEVAHWGNPVFDVAYCLGHLMLKGWHLKKEKESLKLIEVFLDAYNRQINNLIPHLGLMLLARIDGKSPVNYIKDENLKNVIRRVAIDWIKSPLHRMLRINSPVGNLMQTLSEIRKRLIM
ncbi:MAG: aminoglycoside phosphotransferase family protein [Parafilimonas sp.]